MAPNSQKKHIEVDRSQERFVDIEAANHTSDTELEPIVNHRALPNPQVWQDVGGGFQVLLDFLPQDFETYFIGQVQAWINYEQFDPFLPEPDSVSGHEEVALAQDFYSRALLYHGETLTPQEVEAAIHDFITFFNALRHRQHQVTLPRVAWAHGEERVHLFEEQRQQQQQRQRLHGFVM